MIVLLHLTVLATAIRSVSGLQFQKEIEVGKEGRKRCKPMKLICEVSLMGIILIIPDKGKGNSIIITFLAISCNSK